MDAPERANDWEATAGEDSFRALYERHAGKV